MFSRRTTRTKYKGTSGSKMVIFDFDLTLVDTQPVEALRVARNWKAVMAQASNLQVYDGIHELLSQLHERGQTLAIVTQSPDMVPRAFIKRYSWPIPIVLGYHQVRRRKPHPDALLLAMQKAEAEPGTSFHVGDQPEDTEAARAAKMTAIGAGWGLINTELLVASEPDHLFLSVAKLRQFFRDTI